MARGNPLRAARLVAVIVMAGKNHVGINMLRALQQRLQHPGMRITPHHARELDDDRRFGPGRPAKQAVELLQVVDLESAQRIPAVSGLQKANGDVAHG